jgi:hypothetical protein
MSESSRAAWRATESELQDACNQAEDQGDQAAMRGSYRRLEEHYDNRSLGDRIGGVVDRLRGR